MGETVFFLGAGASKPFGVPLTNDILPEILKRISKRKLFRKLDLGRDYSLTERKIMEKRLKLFLIKLMPGIGDLGQNVSIYRKGKTLLITEILSIVDYMIANNQYPFTPSEDFQFKELRYFRNLLDRAINEILDDDNLRRKNKERRYLDGFIAHLRSRAKKDNISIITTNYETAVEKKLYSAEEFPIKNTDFGFSYRLVQDDADDFSVSDDDTDNDEERLMYQPPNPKLRLYKLHGSLNWLKCDMCEHVYINPVWNIMFHAFRKDIDFDDELNVCHCGGGPLKSLIVAPSYEREIKDPNLLHVWKSAAQVLRRADRLVIIGYSLPPEDIAIKSLFIRGRNSRNANDSKLNGLKITVVQKGLEFRERYNLLFGKKNFKFISGGLEEYLKQSR